NFGMGQVDSLGRFYSFRDLEGPPGSCDYVVSRDSTGAFSKVLHSFLGKNQGLLVERRSSNGLVWLLQVLHGELFAATSAALRPDPDSWGSSGKAFSIEIDGFAVLLFVMAFATRFYRLDEPRHIVFDELHYGKFAQMYQKQAFFFDSQPPLGKQLVALAVRFSGIGDAALNYTFTKIGAPYAPDMPVFAMRFVPALCGCILVPIIYHLVVEMGFSHFAAGIAALLVLFDAALNYTFTKIGAPYAPDMPVFAMRFVPALCGCILVPIIYHLVVEMGFSHFAAGIAALLVLFDNGLLCQSRFVLMESQLLLFAAVGLLFVLKITHRKPSNSDYFSASWWLSLVFGIGFLACAVCVKFVGFFSLCLGAAALARFLWRHVPDKSISSGTLVRHAAIFCAAFVVVPLLVYLTCFYVHLSVLTKAGPHDNVMTSHFQSSLEGGLAAVIQNQPLEIVHGSQITLRHTFGRPCWMHSHEDTYPIKYPDGRGSSHQQQVTCYSFKDVNNWWIVKRPERNDLVVSEPRDRIKHGDIIQLVHGLSSRALNAHDVAAPLSPQHQEVSCYIDYNISMPAQILWRVEIVNRDKVGDFWHTVESQVRLIHVNSTQGLKVSGKQLPEWGYNQYEVVTDRVINQLDTVWNVEEHRHTRNQAQKDRERELILHEMIPMEPTKLSFWEKMLELQLKMLLLGSDSPQQHMYMSSPLEWPFLTRGIAYWISVESNAQIHLLGNVLVWYTGTFALVLYFLLLVFYLMRRRRNCYDIPEDVWQQFRFSGEVLGAGYLMHFVPYFLADRTLFLYNYFPALLFKLLVAAAVFDHFRVLLTLAGSKKLQILAKTSAVVILMGIAFVFFKFLPLSYGLTELTKDQVENLRWKDTWDLIVHKK
ncbi:unnamed protein product, partial [Notodromas monacha]